MLVLDFLCVCIQYTTFLLLFLLAARLLPMGFQIGFAQRSCICGSSPRPLLCTWGAVRPPQGLLCNKHHSAPSLETTCRAPCSPNRSIRSVGWEFWRVVRSRSCPVEKKQCFFKLWPTWFLSALKLIPQIRSNPDFYNIYIHYRQELCLG